MEKFMYFSLALFLAMMTMVPPRPVQMPHKPAPAETPHGITVITPNEPQAVIDQSKPNKVNVKAEFWHSPE